jgi:mannose-1-phosphate guanylyltransferase
MVHTPHWAAVLAGGEGLRLQPLIASVVGERRPKQYCRLIGPKTLLGETRGRLAAAVPVEQTVFVVARSHERFYAADLADAPKGSLIVQPQNRGTFAAVALTLIQLRAAGVDGVVGFFPCDHYYRDPELFQHVVSIAYKQARQRSDLVVLLGAQATGPETDYGWIEPGGVLYTQGRAGGCRWSLRSVRRFVEKPTTAVAKDLLDRGCAWNTLVALGHIDAFEALLRSARPDIFDALARIGSGASEADVAAVYRTLPSACLSRAALAAAPERLAVLTVPDLGWTDLGRPERVADVLADRHHILEQYMAG